jgi:hypothetical protein
VLNVKGDEIYKTKRKEEIVKSDLSAKNAQNRVFVVQFRDPTEPRAARFAGRAEHIMSGQSAGFETPEELVDFFRRVIKQLRLRSQESN